MSGQWCHHEYHHILGAKDEHTHVVIFEDSLRKQMLICDNCVSYMTTIK